MEKTEVVTKLKKAGYQVQFDSSVVTVILPEKANTNQEIKRLKAFLTEIGYDSSFGVKQSRKKAAKAQDKNTDFLVEKEENVEETTELAADHFSENSDSMTEEMEMVEIGEQFSLEDFGIS